MPNSRSQGALLSNGSSADLKDQFGLGYRLHIRPSVFHSYQHLYHAATN